MVRGGIGELLNVAPDRELQRQVRTRVRPVLDGLEMTCAYLRMVKVGRWFSVVIHVVLPEAFRLERVAELDAVRSRVAAALEGVHPNLVVDTVFTEDGRWARGPGISAEQVEHLRLDRDTSMDPA
jgi:predicted Co/Zn/Cd cation transporter (cation efflux family)